MASALLERSFELLRGLGAREAGARRWFVPGRIEVLGKHTDYAGGRSLLCAVERGLCLVSAPRDDDRVRVAAHGAGEAELGLSADEAPRPGHWSNYAVTVARRIARDFAGARGGADIAWASDLPKDAGLSSSAALVVGLFAALAEANALEGRPEYAAGIRSAEDLAGYLGAVENGRGFGSFNGDLGVGTFGGSEDHTAILCCRAGWLSQYRFCPVHFERAMPLPALWRFAVGVSGVVAPKTGAALELYNRLARAVAGPRDSWPAPRREQFEAECDEIIPDVGDALARGEVEALGLPVDRSHALAVRCLGNQVPETIALQRSARELGAAAASAFGAGFGGSVWALVREGEAEEFLACWADRYRSAFPARASAAEFFLTVAGAAMRRL